MPITVIQSTRGSDADQGAVHTITVIPWFVPFRVRYVRRVGMTDEWHAGKICIAKPIRLLSTDAW